MLPTYLLLPVLPMDEIVEVTTTNLGHGSPCVTTAMNAMSVPGSPLFTGRGGTTTVGGDVPLGVTPASQGRLSYPSRVSARVDHFDLMRSSHVSTDDHSIRRVALNISARAATLGSLHGGGAKAPAGGDAEAS